MKTVREDEMIQWIDPILIGTVVFEHVIREMIKHAVPLVKALWRTMIFIITTSWIRDE